VQHKQKGTTHLSGKKEQELTSISINRSRASREKTIDQTPNTKKRAKQEMTKTEKNGFSPKQKFQPLS
jgi:hypothetical protein